MNRKNSLKTNPKKLTVFFFATFCLIFCATYFAFPKTSEASRIYADFPRNQTNVEDVALIKVMLNTENSTFNVVEGTVTVNNPQDISAINTGGSVLDLWPKKPSLEGNKISFTGGSPNGIKGAALLLFTIAVKPSNVDSIQIGFENIATYLSDGKGTKILASGSSQSLSVSEGTAEGTIDNQLAGLISSDKTPPEPFTIDLGSDPALYDGEYFISFYTTDSESGVNRYEVTEGKYPTIRSGNVYILQDQTLASNIEIRVYDNAGNVRIQRLNFTPQLSKTSWAVIIGLGVIVLLIIGFFVKKRFTMNK